MAHWNGAAPDALPTGNPLQFAERLEETAALDAGTEALDVAAGAITSGSAGPLLRGEWLGHALHPLLTDLPLGCWLSAGLLDFAGGKRSAGAAQRLVGLGVLFALPTLASGLADYRSITDQRTRRVAVAHAGGNALVGGLYLWSWSLRRRHHRVLGIAAGTLGGVLAWGTGYLGGHLSFGRGTGVGTRQSVATSPQPAAPAQVEFA